MNITYDHIANFISSLPGGNVGQYAKLLNVSPTRINDYLKNTRKGKKLVKDGKVLGPMRGRMPAWAGYKTARGVLTADNVPTDGPALTRILATIPRVYHDDAIYMFKRLVHMSSGNTGFNEVLDQVTGPYRNLAVQHQEQQLRISGLDKEVARLERIFELNEKIAIQQREALALTDQRVAEPA
jgi:hypothetical protein